MGDIAAMQDTTERSAGVDATTLAVMSKDAAVAAQQQQSSACDAAAQQPAAAALVQQQQPLLPVLLQQPPGIGSAYAGGSPPSPEQQQVLLQAALAEAGSNEGSDGSGGDLGRHLPPRRTYNHVDVDTAKQAAMSALAGLDMTTTKANLDASKAAAATARANGEVPTHPRKSNLRSVSCRQLTGSSGGAAPGGVGKTVAFTVDEAPGSAGATKGRSADGSGTSSLASSSTGKTVQWRTGTATGDASAVPRRATRAPASRCISLPQVLQGRAGMASRLAATYAQDAALQQQLQLLNGGAASHTHPLAAAGFQQQQQVPTGVMPQVDVLSMYQLQQAVATGAGGGGQLLSHRSLGPNLALGAMDDSMLQLRSAGAGLMVGQQQQQLGGWPAGAAQQQAQQHVAWAPGGQVQVPGGGPGAALANQQQLLAQLQGGGQVPGGVVGSGGGGDGLWLQAPAASGGMQLSGVGGPQGLQLVGGGGQAGMGGLQLGGQLQQAGGGGAPGATSAAASTFAALLEQYQQASWALLAAAQTEGSIREQLLTELVLQLTMLHTLSGVLQSSLTPADALSDFNYLGAASRRHMATFARLSSAGDLALQLLALIAPLACRHLGTTDVLEAAFLALDTLALANRDVAAVVGQQRLSAITSLALQLPMDQLLQQQTLCLSWINSLAAAVSRNKQVLESFTEQPGTAQPVPAPAGAGAALLQGPPISGPSGLGGLPLAVSQPLILSPTGGGTPGLSPTAPGKTPLATYFEEVSPARGAAGGGGAPALAGLRGDGLMADGLGGLALGAPGGDATAAALAGLSNLSLAGAGPQLPPAAGVPVAGAAAVAAAAGGPSSSTSSTAAGADGGGLLGGGLSLFGGTAGLLGGGAAAAGAGAAPGAAGGSQGGGGPAGIIGV